MYIQLQDPEQAHPDMRQPVTNPDKKTKISGQIWSPGSSPVRQFGDSANDRVSKRDTARYNAIVAGGTLERQGQNEFPKLDLALRVPVQVTLQNSLFFFSFFL